MIRGVTQSDASLLVVAADDGVQDLTREHALISRVIGGDQFLVAVTKMDSVGYDREAFESTAEEIRELLTQLPGIDRDVPIVPVSGLEGRNVTPEDEGIEWHGGSSLVETLDSLQPPPSRDEKPLRLPIDDKQTMTGIGTTVAGTVRTGKLRPNNEIVVKPSDTQCVVRSIEMYHEKVGLASPRDNVGVNLSGITIINAIPRSVCGHVDAPPNTAEAIEGTIRVVREPPVIKPGIKAVFHAHAAQSPCEITAVGDAELDAGSQMGTLSQGESGTVRLQFPEEIAIETEAEFPPLGTFLLRDNNETLAYGDVVELL
jgi:translation elongation factor EF-1alpha